MSTTDITRTSLLVDPTNPSETLGRCAGMARLLACIDYQEGLPDDADMMLGALLNGMAEAMEQAAESFGLPARVLATADWSAGSSAKN